MTKQEEDVSSNTIIELYDEYNRLTGSYMKIYDKEKAKLPYPINLIDLLGANENAHSRVLQTLLGQKEILESFLHYLQSLKESFNFKIHDPKITAEKDRIDVLIRDKSYSIIIENKIYRAKDQPQQLKRYIDKIKDKNYREEQIFVIYLSKNPDDVPNDETWDNGDYKEKFESRFLNLSFRNDILDWIKTSALPNCRLKDTYLRSCLEQYVDYLEGLFNIRKINKNMNNALEKHIKNELSIDFATPEESHAALSAKIKSFDKMKNKLYIMQEELEKECWAKWIVQLKNDFPTLTIFDKHTDNKYPKIGIAFEKGNIKFRVLIEKETNIYYGIARHYSSTELDGETAKFVAPLFLDEIFEKDQWWYGWKYTSFKNGYTRLKALIEATVKLVDAQ